MVTNMKSRIVSALTSPIRWLRRNWKLAIVLGLVLAAIGWWQWSQQQKNKPQLTFATPTIMDLTKTLQVSGLVDADQKANLRFANGGKVTSVKAQEGDQVTKGQTIATIDRRELEKRLQQDLNSYLRERWDFEDTQDATNYHVENLATRRDLDQQQWDLNDTVLDVEIRDIAIQNTVLSAPFTGVLVSSPVTIPGSNLLATDVFELINPQTLVFKALVDEADISTVKVGQSVTISLDAFPKQSLQSYVESIAYKSSESSTGTVFVVKIPLATYSSMLPIRLGMNGDATITIDTRRQVMTVPLDATRQRDEQVLVDIRTGPDSYQERAIETDLETDEAIEVLKGLSPTDEILLPETKD